MAGTDKTRKRAGASTGPQPAIILVEPQLGENIGTAVRAMLNCGLTELRVVNPRDGWANEKAVAAASGADAILKKARLYESTADAVADLRYVFAATARERDMTKSVATPRQAARALRRHAAFGHACGVLFGPERRGLTNDDVVLADTLLVASLNPTFRSINLAQAVLIVAYEWFMAGPPMAPETMKKGGSEPATKGELLDFLAHLESELDRTGFLRLKEKRPVMVRNIRNLFLRARLMDHEARTLHGIIVALTGRRWQKR
jgi:tRNA/rRNA methyltransferase